nr:death domain-associated protein 6-like isoform X2 [Maniola hyperantus]
MSDKYKEKIVKLYKELCTLTGAEATKRREVRLTVIEGHPPGPVRRLEMFLNRNIGEDGNPPFPDFNDVVKCVETANVNDNLGWNKFQVMREASALFMHCGRALQKRRQKREWSDLLSRVKAEECDSDPADNDPELLARLEVNRRVAVKKEADLLERYSMMQNLPPEPKRNTATNVTQSQDAVKITSVTSGNDDSSDEIDSPQVNKNENNILTLTKENKINQLDSIKIGSVNCNPKAHSEIETNKINLVQNASLVMPQIIADSITNKSYTDEFGLKINDSKGISNVQDNYSTSNVTVKSESNVAEVDFETNVALNKTARLIARLAFESNAEANCKSNIKSNLGVVNFESNVETNKIHVVGLTFESNVEENCESNIKSNVGDVNFESNVAPNKTQVGEVNFESNVVTNKTHVSRLALESNFEDGNLKANIVEVKFEPNVEQVNTESNAEENFESNSEEVNSIEASVKTEFDEANIKTEPTENVAKILDDFGDNYTVSIFDFADPFLIVEISDSSDDED